MFLLFEVLRRRNREFVIFLLLVKVRAAQKCETPYSHDVKLQSAITQVL